MFAGDRFDRGAAGVELFRAQPDIRVPPEAPREHAGGLDRWRVRQPLRQSERADRNSPLPAIAGWIVLGIAAHLDHGEDRLPARGVAESEVALLQARPPGRGVRVEPARVDALRQETVSAPANEEPVLHSPSGFLTGREYAGRIRASAVLALASTILVLASGCGDSKEAGPAGTTTEATTTAQTTTAETTTAADPMEGAGTTPVKAAPTGTTTALLERVALGRHEGFDRVVFEFTNNLPGYRVEYVKPPLTEDGSGNTVQVDGNAFVMVRMEPASGFDLSKPEGELVYKGPKRIAGSSAGTSVVKEVVRTGDFEAVLSWAIGLSDRVDFRVTTASSPARLIVDFRNH